MCKKQGGKDPATEEFLSIDALVKSIKTKLDPTGKSLLLYAYNGIGKTRLSRLFCKNVHTTGKVKVLYYNAFTEDLFTWDNKAYNLKFNKDLWIFTLIQDEGLEGQIIDNFKELTNTKIEPLFNLEKSIISFNIPTGDNRSEENIKISKGEESCFIWSFFYTIIQTAIVYLEEGDNKNIEKFNNLEYIIIDDPVSSIDDTRIITNALNIASLIASASQLKIKTLITTHHALFFNILFQKNKQNSYILSKKEAGFKLKRQEEESPFAYHHLLIADIKEAINNNEIKKYHFNLFRTVLEKTANFLGYNHWSKCIEKNDKEQSVIIKKINHYSHNRLSDLESTDLSEQDKTEFKAVFESFLKDFKWFIKKEEN